MPVIRRGEVDPKLRRKFDGPHRVQLRQAMLSPGITEEQRRALKESLDTLGQDRVYRSGTPPRPGAIDFSAQDLRPTEEPQESLPSINREGLAQMKRADLVVLAQQKGLPTQGTKAQLLSRLLETPAA